MIDERHTEPCFARTIIGVGRDGFDEELNELISNYPNYEIKNFFVVNIDTVQEWKDSGDDNTNALYFIPRIWVTVIMEERTTEI